MAEGFANVYGKGKIKAFSAGTEPMGLNHFALEVMGEKGIDIHRQFSKPFSEELAREMDYVITVCGNARGGARSFLRRSGAFTGPLRIQPRRLVYLGRSGRPSGARAMRSIV